MVSLSVFSVFLLSLTCFFLSCEIDEFRGWGGGVPKFSIFRGRSIPLFVHVFVNPFRLSGNLQSAPVLFSFNWYFFLCYLPELCER